MQQGTGGSNDGYTNNQRMAVGIQRPTSSNELAINISNTGGFPVGAESYAHNATVTFGNTSCGFWNFTLSPDDISGTLGVKLVNTATNAVTYICQDNINFSAGYQYGFRSYSVPGSKFPTSGRYIVTPAFKTSAGKWVDIRPDITASSPLYCDATASTLTFSNPEAGAIEITEFEVLSETYLGYPISYRWKLVNTTPEMMGEFASALCTRTASGYNVIGSGENRNYDIMKGETIEDTWTTLFEGKLTARQYYLTFFLDGVVIDAFPVTLKANPGELAYNTPTFVSLNPEGDVALNRRSRAAVINPAHDLKASVELTSGYFGDLVTLDIYHNTGRKVASTDPVFWSGIGGETLTLTAHHSIFADLSPDVLYYTLLQPANGTQMPATVSINASIWFKLSEASGVEDVAVDNTDAPAVYFDLQGREVDNPAAGLYIVRRGDKVTKEYVK